MCAEWPNDPKLSDRGGWRAGCMVGERRRQEAASVTAVAVRCSAWLGVGVRSTRDPKHGALANFSGCSEPPKACGVSEADCNQTLDNLSPRREG